jgi:hypothetical protein
MRYTDVAAVFIKCIIVCIKGNTGYTGLCWETGSGCVESSIDIDRLGIVEYIAGIDEYSIGVGRLVYSIGEKDMSMVALW